MSLNSVAEAERISDLVVLTAGRPAGLARVLKSYASALDRERSGDVRITVFDDSDCASVEAQNRLIAEAVCRRPPVRVIGRPERRDLVARLVRAGCPEDVVSFALFGPAWHGRSAGANRNAVLLAMMGRLLVSIDDDTEARGTESPCSVAGASWRAGDAWSPDPAVPCDIWTFPSRDALVAGHEWRDIDVIDRHQRVLGRDVRACLRAIDPGPPSLETDVPVATRVVVSLNGLAGDCGWRTPSHYLWTTGATLDRLTMSPEHYADACCSREMLRVSRSCTFVKQSNNLMATFFGVDNRTLLPPFMPIGRGQDVLFGLLVSCCIEGACFAHLPWALLHTPVEQRTFARDDMLAAAMGVDLSVVLAALVRDCAPLSSVGDDASRLRELGRALEDVAVQGPSQAAARIRDSVLRLTTCHVNTLEMTTHAGHERSGWSHDVARYLDAWKISTRRRDYHIPVECLAGTDGRGALSRLLAYVHDFARLLQWWPDVVARCVEFPQGQHLMGARLDPS